MKTLVVATVGAVVSLTALMLALVFRFDAGNKVRQLGVENCRAIENVKAQLVMQTKARDELTLARTDLAPSVKQAYHLVNLRAVRDLAPRDCP